MATWRSGYAAACKAVYTGSIPVVASPEQLSAEPPPANAAFVSTPLYSLTRMR
jgi:hypothetical protein